MGLDISGVTIGPVKTINPEETYEVFVLEGFERSLQKDEIVKIDCEFDNVEDVGGITGVSMSYSSYNQFRRLLSLATTGLDVKEVWERASELDEDEPYPLAIYHILNFADNEGYIGPKAVKELDEYFKSNDIVIDDEYYNEKLIQLTDTIHLTAIKNGYLQFA